MQGKKRIQQPVAAATGVFKPRKDVVINRHEIVSGLETSNQTSQEE